MDCCPGSKDVLQSTCETTLAHFNLLDIFHNQEVVQPKIISKVTTTSTKEGENIKQYFKNRIDYSTGMVIQSKCGSTTLNDIWQLTGSHRKKIYKKLRANQVFGP